MSRYELDTMEGQKRCKKYLYFVERLAVVFYFYFLVECLFLKGF